MNSHRAPIFFVEVSCVILYEIDGDSREVFELDGFLFGKKWSMNLSGRYDVKCAGRNDCFT